MLDFNCDRQSKNDFTASTVSWVSNNYPEWTVTFSEQDEEGEFVEYGSALADDKAHIDVFAHLCNKNTYREITYSAELKERTISSTAYGEEGKEGWVYNYEKDGYLVKEVEKGRIPLFVCLFPDDKIRIWRIMDVDKTHNISLPIKKINIDPDSERVMQDRIQLWNKDSKVIPRLRG